MQNEDVVSRAGIDPLEKGETALWRAVIAWAIEDARGYGHGVGGMYRDMAMDAARVWFEGAGKDFQLVCDLAGLDAQAVRARATAEIESAAPPAARRFVPSHRRAGVTLLVTPGGECRPAGS